MTEDSRGSVDNPPREDDPIVPGFAAEQPGEGPGSPPSTADDIEQVTQDPEDSAEPADDPEPEDTGLVPPDSPGQSDKLLVSGPQKSGPYEPYGQQPPPYQEAPPLVMDPAAAYGQDPVMGQDTPFGQDSVMGQDTPYGQDATGGQDPVMGQDSSYGQDTAYGQGSVGGQGPAAGQGAPYGQDPVMGQDTPYGQGAGQEASAGLRQEPPAYQEPSQYGREPSQAASYAPDGRVPRPGFVPHDQREPGRYGWPPAQQHQGPPPPAGPPLSTAPPPPGGAAPLGQPRPGGAGFGGPGGGGPNWSPVPAPPSPTRGGPALGVLAVVALIVALVAGAVGAGIGVMATDNKDGSSEGDSGVSLGGGSGSGGGEVKNRPPDSVAGVAQRVRPSVVMIRVTNGNEGGAGSGFFVKGGYIVTNNHVVAPAANGGKIEVVFQDKSVSPATIKGRDPGSDVAVLQPQTSHTLPPLEVGNSDSLAVGDPVIAIGSPLGLQGSVTSGIVSSLNRAVPTKGEGADASVIPAIQTDAAINPGNSGGPLVDGKGAVIGINTAIATLGGGGLGGEQGGSIGLGFAIPINHAKRIAEEIINTGTAKRALLGIGMDQQFPGPGARIAASPQGGVPPIVKGGPADKAGLKPGDIITKIDGQQVDSRLDLGAMIRSKAPGTKVKVTYTRGGKESVVDVVLGEAN